MITFEIVTIFPKIFDSYFNESILKRAQKNKKIKIKIHNLRDFTHDKHHTVDDKPYGGGQGMIFKIEPLYECLKKLKIKDKKSKIILLDPAGKQFDQKMAQQFSKLKRVVMISGRYEGIDARLKEFVNETVSIGPYVLAGGELPAMIMVEAVARLVPGVLGHEHSAQDDTFSIDKDYVEYPQYTRPEIFKVGKKILKVPQVLLSGNHAEIRKWKKKMAGVKK